MHKPKKKQMERGPRMSKARSLRSLLFWRLRQGLTLEQLSARTRVSKATLCRIETGLCKVSVRARVRLKDGLGLSTKQLDALLGAMDNGNAQGRPESVAKGRRLREWRLRLGLTLERLAQRSRISMATISRIENGIPVRPQVRSGILRVLKRLEKIARA